MHEGALIAIDSYLLFVGAPALLVIAHGPDKLARIFINMAKTHHDCIL